MHPAHPQATDRRPESVWDTVVSVTERVGTPEAKAIRVLVYLVLLEPGAHRWTDRVRSRAHFLRRLVIPKGAALPCATKGQPLFAFLYDTPANTNNLLPVLGAARKRGAQPGLLTGTGLNLSGKGLNGYAPAVGVRDLMATSTPRETWAAMRSARQHFASVVAELAIQVPAWAKELSTDPSGITRELALAQIATRGLERLYSKWEPSAVISTSNLWPFDCAVYDEARRLGIPSVIIQHGVTNHYWWPFAASKMLLWGKRFETELLEFGAGADQLAVCGMPAADPLFARFSRQIAVESPRSAKTVVVLSHAHARAANPQLYDRFLELLDSLVQATPSIQWTVKLHPNEDDRFYQPLLERRLPNFGLLPKSMPLEAAVNQADLACTLFSTSGLEAMMMQRPLVVFDLAPLIHDYAWWPKFGGGTYVNSLPAMMDYLGKAQSDPRYLSELVSRQDQFLAQNFANHGRAAESVWEAVETLLHRDETTPIARIPLLSSGRSC